jgi:hypothetical protein
MMTRAEALTIWASALELEPVDAVADPSTAGVDPLAGPDCGRVAHHGHEVSFASRVDLEDAEAVLDVVEGDALDCSRKRLDRRGALKLSRPDRLVHALVLG